MLGLAVTVRITAGQYLRNRIAVAFAPLLTVGFYYIVATNVHLTQTEGLVGLPIYCHYSLPPGPSARMLETGGAGSPPPG